MKKHITYGLCIFSGILLVVGLRSASAAPAATPPSGNVNPSFNQVYVADTLQSKTANISGDLTVTGATNLAGDTYAIGNLNVQNGANVQGMLEVADITASGDIDMSGDLQVSKTIEVGGELRAKGGIVNPDGYVKINDGLDIQGTIKNSNGGLSIIDFDGVKINGPTTILKGPLDLQGIDIINTATQPAAAGGGDQPVYIKDSLHLIGGKPSNLTVTGDISGVNIFSSGDLNAASMQISGKAALLGDTEIKNAYITGSLQSSAGDGDFVKIDDQLDVRKGIFNNDDTKLIKFGSGSSPMDLSVTGKSTLSGNVDIKGEISNSSSGSPVNIKDDLKVTGNIKTSGTGKIGKYTIRSSGPHSVLSGGSLTKAKACNSGETVISCSYKGKSPTAASEDYTFGLELNNMIISDSSATTDKNSCKVSVKNTIANKLDLYVYSVCFDPTSN